MATLTPMCVVDPETKEADWSNFFSAFRNAFDWFAIEFVDDNEVNFYITEKIWLSCRNFENTRKAKTTQTLAKIWLVCNGNEQSIYAAHGLEFTPGRRGFRFLQGAGGFALQLGYSPYDWDEEVLYRSNTMLILAGLHCLDLAENRQSLGIYVPKYHGTINYNSSTQEYTFREVDPTPLYFVTEDTDIMQSAMDNRCVYMTGATADISGTITGVGEYTSGIGGDIYVSYLPKKMGIPTGTEMNIYDSQGYPIGDITVSEYNNETNYLKINTLGYIFEQIEVGMNYTIEDVPLPVPSVFVPITGVQTNCISNGATVRLMGNDQGTIGGLDLG